MEVIRGARDLGIRPGTFQSIGQWLSGTSGTADRLDRPFGMCVDEQGNLLVTDTSTPAVCMFDIQNLKWRSWSEIGGVLLQSPVSAVKAGDRIIVADSALKRVFVIDSNGKLLHELRHTMERPSGLAVADERIFVADAGAHSILAFDDAGNFLFSFGKRGSGEAELNFPTHLATGRNGELLVTDSMNCRVEVFDRNGGFVRQIGSAGDSPGHFSRPKGVAVDSEGNVFVVDALFDNIQIFDSEGNLLLGVGEAGSKPGEFWMPNGIAIGKDQRIYVADSYNHRIQVLRLLPQP